MVKNPPINAEDAGDMGSIPSQEDPPEKQMATYSSILAWETPGTGTCGATVHETTKSRT